MRPIPRDNAIDSTLAWMADPYLFIQKRCKAFGSDLFETRLLLQRTVCMNGPEAAKLFYDPERFIRRGAMPGRIQKTLLGKGGVQGLDDAPHRHRKRMFMSLMSPQRIERLADSVRSEWRAQARRWASRQKIVLYDELHELLTRGVCAWAGVPLAESEVSGRTAEITAMFDYAGSVGPKHWWSRLARKRGDRWMAEIVDQVRAGRLHPPEDTAAHVISWHRDPDGALLSPRVAAVELINVVRPTVATAVYITFVAHALHQYPECRRKLESGDERYAELFVQEVRRFYPFFPSVGARVRRDFEWKGYRFPEGRRVILDLYGTNHDPRTWQAPEKFRPERFSTWDRSPFNFIPQGGGDHEVNHRCPGEWIVIALMKLATDVLVRRLSYDVPPQDLSIDYSRLPALPRSRFVIRNVRHDTEFSQTTF